MSDQKKDAGPEMEKHEYDGIIELDNQLPSWWKNLFYLTIVFSLGYVFHYMIGEGPSLLTEYERDRVAWVGQDLVRKASVKLASEDELKVLVAKPELRAQGQEHFKTKCASCHGDKGQGGIGPNLTDDHWLHGGKLSEILKTVSAGVLDKGMPPWSQAMSPPELYSVVSYVRSIRGSKPAGAKAPQGEVFKE